MGDVTRLRAPQNAAAEPPEATLWDPHAALLAIVAAGVKSTALAIRFGMDLGAAWLDAAHTIAELWRAR